MPGPGATASSTAAVRNNTIRAESNMMKRLYDTESLLEPALELCERFHARYPAIAIGAGDIE